MHLYNGNKTTVVQLLQEQWSATNALVQNEGYPKYIVG